MDGGNVTHVDECMDDDKCAMHAAAEWMGAQ